VSAPLGKKAASGKIDYGADLDDGKQKEGEAARKRKADKDAPKKPPQGGYGMFLSEHRARIGGPLPAGSNVVSEVAKIANVQWKALPSEERRPYEEKYAEKMKAYQAALEEHAKAQAAKDEPDPSARKAQRLAKDPTPPAGNTEPKEAAWGCGNRNGRNGT